MKHTKIFLAVFFICLLGLAQSGGATLLTYTDSSTARWLGNDVTYSLDFTLLTGQTYSATFTVSNSLNSTPEWYAGWFLFKFASGNNPADITSFSSPSAFWSVSDTNINSTVEVLQGSTFVTLRQNGYAGFYVTSLDKLSLPPNDPTQGIPLTEGPPLTPYQFTFDFTIPAGDINLESMPFQAGYYDGPVSPTNPQIKYNGLSVDLGAPAPVPEPATMFLLGSGLIGVAGFARRKFRKS